MEEEFSTVDVIKNKVEFIAGLERVVQADKKRVCHVLEQNVAFSHNVFLLRMYTQESVIFIVNPEGMEFNMEIGFYQKSKLDVQQP